MNFKKMTLPGILPGQKFTFYTAIGKKHAYAIEDAVGGGKIMKVFKKTLDGQDPDSQRTFMGTMEEMKRVAKALD